jgi:AAA+ ATPase superfamily predicted ATPase
MFVGRIKELQALNGFYKKPGPQFIVIYGKRRVGKTTLIKEFIKDKSHIYFLAQQITERENLRLLGESTGSFYKDGLLQKTGFTHWDHVFPYLKAKIKKKFIFVIDEFPYLASSSKGISSIFQKGWDEYLKDTHVFLILCGSSIGMMEKDVLSYKAPLYGRSTGQIFLKPFSFLSSREFFPGLSFEHCLEIFSVTGGNPSYLFKMNPHLTLEKNIRKYILKPEEFLYNEVEFILRQELREPRYYFAILKAIALSNNRINEITNETGIEKSNLHRYIFTLEDLGMVYKEIPVTEKNPLKSRKGIYRIQDEFFYFWFRYILPNKSIIEEGAIDYVINKIKLDFPNVIATSYEKAAKEIIRKNQDLIFPFTGAGRWWDRNEEIDVVALNEQERKIIFTEVKWRNKLTGLSVYNNLVKKSTYVSWNRGQRKEYFCLFSKSGFTKELIQLSQGADNLYLFKNDKNIVS